MDVKQYNGIIKSKIKAYLVDVCNSFALRINLKLYKYLINRIAVSIWSISLVPDTDGYNYKGCLDQSPASRS